MELLARERLDDVDVQGDVLGGEAEVRTVAGVPDLPPHLDDPDVVAVEPPFALTAGHGDGTCTSQPLDLRDGELDASREIADPDRGHRRGPGHRTEELAVQLEQRLDL